MRSLLEENYEQYIPGEVKALVASSFCFLPLPSYHARIILHSALGPSRARRGSCYPTASVSVGAGSTRQPSAP